MRALSVTLIGLLLVMGAPSVALADVGNASGSWAITATGTTPWLPLAGQTNCTVTVTGSPVGLTAVPQVATDPAYANVVTASTINSGSITTTGAYNGSVSALGLSAIRVNVTGYTSGSTTLSIVCGPAGGGGGGGAVTQGAGASATPWYFIANPLKTAYCTGTVGTTVSCLSPANATVCANNSGGGNVNSCTITGTTYFASCFNQTGSSESTVSIDVYNSSAATPPAYSHIVNATATQPLGPGQVMSPSYGQPVAASAITIVLGGSGAAQAFSCFYG